MYVIQHYFICRPSDSTMSQDAGIEPRTLAWQPNALTTRLVSFILIYCRRLCGCLLVCRPPLRVTVTACLWGFLCLPSAHLCGCLSNCGLLICCLPLCVLSVSLSPFSVCLSVSRLSVCCLFVSLACHSVWCLSVFLQLAAFCQPSVSLSARIQLNTLIRLPSIMDIVYRATSLISRLF